MNFYNPNNLLYLVQYKNSYGMYFKSDFGKLENRLCSVYKNIISICPLYKINEKLIHQIYPKLKLDHNFVNIAINKNLNRQKNNGFL